MSELIEGLQPRCSISIFNAASTERRSFDATIAQLCRGVMEHESLSKAASGIPISYSNAWNRMRETERVLGVKLITRQRSRGSKLTKDALTLLRAYEGIVEMCEERSAELYAEIVAEEGPGRPDASDAPARDV